MAEPWSLATGIALATGAIGLIRVGVGPTRFDRMLAAQLLGTSLVATLLLAARAWEAPALRDVGLLVALLAAVASIAMVRSGTGGPSP